MWLKAVAICYNFVIENRRDQTYWYVNQISPLSKPCIKCGKKLGFRDSKSSRKEIDATCTAYRNREDLVGDTTCSNELASVMDSKDRACSVCVQDHILGHHLDSFFKDQRAAHTGFLGKRKFKKFMESVPLCFSEITPTWDLDVAGNETFGQLYKIKSDKIQNTERGCPWCKKYFSRAIMIEMGLKYSTVCGGLECHDCKEIRSRLTSERLRNLQSELSRLARRAEGVTASIEVAKSAQSSATNRNIAGHFMSGYKMDLTRSDFTSYASSEADARYEALRGEANEIVGYMDDLFREIEVEQLILAEEHFGAPTLLPKKEPRRKEPRQEEPKQEEQSSSCSNCGKPLKPTAKFCGGCGTKCS